MLNSRHKLKGLSLIHAINNNLPVKPGAPSPIIPREQSVTPIDPVPQPSEAISSSFHDSLGLVDAASSASFRNTPKVKSKAKGVRSRKSASPLHEFNPFGNSFGAFSDAAAAALAEDEEILEDKTIKVAETEFTGSLQQEPPSAVVVSDEELATINAIDHAISSQNIDQIANLLELPFAKKHLFFKAYTVPGNFFLATKSNPNHAIAVFKVGETRPMHDLTLLKFSELLDMKSFFPKSIIKAIPVGEYMNDTDDEQLPAGIPERPVSDLTDLVNIHGVTLDRHMEFTFNQAEAIRKKLWLIGSFQEFINDQDPGPITPIHSARIVMLAYILFIKDLKSEDGGILNCTDGIPKLVDAVDNALMYFSLLLPEDTAKHIISINIPFIDKVKDQVIHADQIKLLHEQYTEFLGGFIERLTRIILEEKEYAVQLQKVISSHTKRELIDSHPGHTFIEDPRKLAEYIHARLEQVVFGLGNLQQQGKSVTILELLEAVDPVYVSAYKIVEKAKNGEDLQGRVSRSTINAYQMVTPGEAVGSRAFPYHPEHFPSVDLANYADDLFYNIKDFLKYITKDKSAQEMLGDREQKLLRKVKQVNDYFKIVKFNFPTHQDLAFPHKGQQLARAEAALGNLEIIDKKLKELFSSAYDDSPQISKFKSNIEYLQKQIASRKALETQLPYASSSPPITATVDHRVTPDHGSPEITAIMDLHLAEKLFSHPVSDPGCKRSESTLPSPLVFLSPTATESKLISGFRPGRGGAFVSISTLPRVASGSASSVSDGGAALESDKRSNEAPPQPKPNKT